MWKSHPAGACRFNFWFPFDVAVAALCLNSVPLKSSQLPSCSHVFVGSSRGNKAELPAGLLGLRRILCIIGSGVHHRFEPPAEASFIGQQRDRAAPGAAEADEAAEEGAAERAAECAATPQKAEAQGAAAHRGRFAGGDAAAPGRKLPEGPQGPPRSLQPSTPWTTRTQKCVAQHRPVHMRRTGMRGTPTSELPAALRQEAVFRLMCCAVALYIVASAM